VKLANGWHWAVMIAWASVSTIWARDWRLEQPYTVGSRGSVRSLVVGFIIQNHYRRARIIVPIRKKAHDPLACAAGFNWWRTGNCGCMDRAVSFILSPLIGAVPSDRCRCVFQVHDESAGRMIMEGAREASKYRYCFMGVLTGNVDSVCHRRGHQIAAARRLPLVPGDLRPISGFVARGGQTL